MSGSLLLLLFELSLLVPLSADCCRYPWLLPGCQPVGILLDALALRFTVDIEGSAVSGLRGSGDRFGAGGRFRVRGIGFEAVFIGESSPGIVERVEFLYFRGTLRCGRTVRGRTC